MSFGFGFGFPRYIPYGESAAFDEFMVLDSAGALYYCPLTVLDSDDNPYIVTQTVLASDNTPYLVL